VAEMQNLASPTDSGWLDIMSRLPADLDLNQVARETKAIQRLRGITGKRGKTPGTAAFFSCADSPLWTLCIMCRRRPPFPR
jgi:hypothetical protein